MMFFPRLLLLALLLLTGLLPGQAVAGDARLQLEQIRQQRAELKQVQETLEKQLGKLGQELLDLLPPKKLVGLAYGANGFRQVTNSRRPVRTPADLKALKIRVPAIKMYVSLFKLLGADPSSMNFGELFTAVKEGTMDGQENPLAVIQQSKLYEVQKYVTRWDYSYDPLVLCMNKKRWESFSPEQQELLKTAAVEAMDYERKLVEAGRDALEKKLQEFRTSGP